MSNIRAIHFLILPARLLAFLFLLTSCALQETNFIGTYEQQPIEDFSHQKDEEHQKRYLDKFQKSKIIIKITNDAVYVSMGKESNDSFSLPYAIYDKTLVATDNKTMYYVLYKKDENTIYSTGMEFKKIAPNTIP